MKNEIILNSIKIQKLLDSASMRIDQAKQKVKILNKDSEELRENQVKLKGFIDKSSEIKDEFRFSKKMVEEATQRVAKVISALESAGETMGAANNAHSNFQDEIQRLKNSLLPKEPPFKK